MSGHGSPPPEDRANRRERQVAWGRAANERAYADIQSRLPPQQSGRDRRAQARMEQDRATYVARAAQPPKTGFLDKPRFAGGEGFSHPGGTYTRPKVSIREKLGF